MNRILDIASCLAVIGAACVVGWSALRARDSAGRPVGPEVAIPQELVENAGEPVMGAPDASIGMIVFSDFECPFCADFARELLPTIKAEFVDAGSLRVAFRHLPLTAVHPGARSAALASECASEQGKFWPFHDLIFDGPRPLVPDAVSNVAAMAEVDNERFHECVASESMEARVNSDIAAARRYGIRVTPTFLIGTIDDIGRLRVTQAIVGLRRLQEFRELLAGHVEAARSK